MRGGPGGCLLAACLLLQPRGAAAGGHRLGGPLPRGHPGSGEAGWGYLGLGQLLEHEDRYGEAEAMYAHGLAVMPAAGEVGYFLHNNRGYCVNALGHHAEAEVHCRAAIAIDPTRPNAHKNLGLALAGQGRLLEAARCFLEADRRNPADARARQHLAELITDHPEILKGDPALAAACRERGVGSVRVGNA